MNSTHIKMPTPTALMLTEATDGKVSLHLLGPDLSEAQISQWKSSDSECCELVKVADVLQMNPGDLALRARLEAFNTAAEYHEEMRRGYLAHADNIRQGKMGDQAYSTAMAAAAKHAEFAEDLRRISRREAPVYGSAQYKQDLFSSTGGMQPGRAEST